MEGLGGEDGTLDRGESNMGSMPFRTGRCKLKKIQIQNMVH